MSQQLIGSIIVAAGAFAGLVAGFMLNVRARRIAHRDDVLARAEAAVASVVAAMHPVTNVSVPGWHLSDEQRVELQTELEMEAGRRLASSSHEAVSALAAASRYAPLLRIIVTSGPPGVIEDPQAILDALAAAR